MAQLPSALACQAARPSCTISPVRCTAKSTMVVVPPQAAARVPVSKVSEAAVPPNGSCMWVCTSIPPGTTYLPVASITASAATPAASARPGANSAATVSPSTSTSIGCPPVAFTTVPPEIRTVDMAVASRLDQVAVRVRPAVPVERPPVAHLGDQVHVQVPDDQVRVVVVPDIADELPLRVDEVRGAVEVVVAQVLGADPVDRPDVVLVGHRRGRLLQLPQVRRQAAAGRRRVEDDLRPAQPQRPPALREVPVVADVDADPADRGVERRVAQVARPEVELLQEAVHLRDVRLAVLPEVPPVGIDDRRGVVEHARLLLLVHRQHHHQAQFGG